MHLVHNEPFRNGGLVLSKNILTGQKLTRIKGVINLSDTPIFAKNTLDKVAMY